MTKPTQGGARAGAGAPKVADKAKSRTISLNDANFKAFKLLGGVTWLRAMIKEKPIDSK